MLTLNAADEPYRPGWWVHYPTNAAAPLPMTLRITPTATAGMTELPWLRSDRVSTVPVMYPQASVAVGCNPNLTYVIYPGPHVEVPRG